MQRLTTAVFANFTNRFVNFDLGDIDLEMIPDETLNRKRFNKSVSSQSDGAIDDGVIDDRAIDTVAIDTGEDVIDESRVTVDTLIMEPQLEPRDVEENSTSKEDGKVETPPFALVLEMGKEDNEKNDNHADLDV